MENRTRGRSSLKSGTLVSGSLSSPVVVGSLCGDSKSRQHELAELSRISGARQLEFRVR